MSAPNSVRLILGKSSPSRLRSKLTSPSSFGFSTVFDYQPQTSQEFGDGLLEHKLQYDKYKIIGTLVKIARQVETAAIAKKNDDTSHILTTLLL